MTTEEFSNEFDVLLNSYAGQSNIVLDEYEKSLFLTMAQERVVLELYSGRNNRGSSFEDTEELRSSLRNLVKTKILEESDSDYEGLTEYSRFFILPDDVLFITYESAIIDDNNAGCSNGKKIIIVPVTQDELERVENNPFRGANKRRALRLDNAKESIELISKYNVRNYTIRYLSKPSPIVLENFEYEGVSINGVNTITECELDSATHRYILEKAVALAMASRGIQNKGNV